ncbi:hypothetical protein IA54_000415 [Xanthomonas phaseoli pv. syngonii LMG 9055]|uniref:Uncharacterized protein n=1 Tax=Xanthomonas phaseoli pv. syngonii LMG 9055 TaxID=1437878 RepID=A0A1V9H6P0_9XANT|nr:hypothetical protein IA54_000415 [Xanthomonas phaseoli pv. syngonii LMG 9055]
MLNGARIAAVHWRASDVGMVFADLGRVRSILSCAVHAAAFAQPGAFAARQMAPNTRRCTSA